MTMMRNITTAGKGPLETAVIKATWDDNDKPKQKHVETCLKEIRTQANSSSQDFRIVDLILERLQNKSWRVVFKSLLLIHQLFREGEEAFITAVSEKRSKVFNSSLIHRTSENQDTVAHSSFIRRYARYLEAKTKIMEDFGFLCERKISTGAGEYFNSYHFKELGKLLPRLMQQCQLLLYCEVYFSAEYVENVHPLACWGLLLLFKDSWKIWAGIQMVMMKLLESFQHMSIDQAKWTLKMTETFQEMNEKFSTWEGSVSREVIPFEQNTKYKTKLSPLPVSLVESLKSYIAEREETDNIQTEQLDFSGLEISKNDPDEPEQVDDLLGFGTPEAAMAPAQAQKQDDEWGVFSDPNFGSEPGKTFTDTVDSELAALSKPVTQAPQQKKNDDFFDPMNFTSEPKQVQDTNSKVDDLLNFNTTQPKAQNDIFSSFTQPAPVQNFGFQAQQQPAFDAFANASPFGAPAHNPNPFSGFQTQPQPQPFFQPQPQQPTHDPFAALQAKGGMQQADMGPKRTFKKKEKKTFDDLVSFG